MVILMLSGILNWSHKVLKSLLALQFMLCLWIKPLGNATRRDLCRTWCLLGNLIEDKRTHEWGLEEAGGGGHLGRPDLLVGAGKPVRGRLRGLSCEVKETRTHEAPVLFQCPVSHVSLMKLQVVLECLPSPAHRNQQHCHPLGGKENFQIILCW